MNRRLAPLVALFSFFALGTRGVPPTDPPAIVAASEANVNVVGPGGQAETVLGLYNAFMKEHGRAIAWQPGTPLPPAQLALLKSLLSQLYPAAGAGGADAHKTVAFLVSQGLSEKSVGDAFRERFREEGWQHWQISDSMSLAMAEARDVLIEQSILEVAGKEGWMVGRSDSGNPKSGMRSDLDQTFFVFRVDPETGAPVRDESLDSVFIDKFERHWTATHGELALKMLDVVSIGGKNRFPDPRSTTVHVDFEQAYHSTLAELRNTPGAYTTYGAVMQQVQRRMMETLDALQNPENAGLWREKRRIWQEYGPNRARPGTASKNPKPDFSLAARTMFFAPADLLPDSALGAAVANYLELQHYMHQPKFNTKYHLRTFDDALYSLHLLETGGGLKDKIDYSAMGVERRRKVGQELLAKVFPGDPKKQKQHLLALEISCDLRIEHTSEKPEDFMRVEAYKRHGSVPSDPDARKRLIYEDFARELYGTAFKPDDPDPKSRAVTKEQIKAAEEHYRRTASELCLEAVNKTAGDALAFFTDPARSDSLFERSRPLLEKTSPAGVDWHATKQNVAESARITLLYSIHDLGILGGAQLLRRLGAETGAGTVDLFKIYVRGQLAPISSFRANPDAYIRTWRKQTGELAERVYLHSLADLGFVDLGKARYTLDLLGGQKLVWSPVQFAENWADSAFMDRGSLGSLAEIAKAYVLAKGDVTQIVSAIAGELLGAMPVIGTVVTASQADAAGLVKLVVTLASPTGATVLLVHQIGEAGYAIYEVEVGQPARDNVLDALYRGFAGPETISFGEPGKPPPMWTNEDEAALRSVRQEISRAKPPPMEPIHLMAAPDRHRYLLWRAEREEQWERDRKVLEPKLDALLAKERDFIQYRDGSGSGGFYLGLGAVKDQRWLTTSLLDAITPVYGFVTSGVVDLRTPFVPERDEPRLAELRAAARSGDDVEASMEAAAALQQLESVKERWERSHRYEKHAREKSPGLLCRLKRDSVFRHVQENRINMDAFVDEFVAKHGETLAKELEALDLLYPKTVMPPRIRGEPSGEVGRVYSIDAYKDALKERLKADYERSRALSADYLKFEKERAKITTENLARAKTMFRNEMLGMAVGALGDNEEVSRYYGALRASAIRRQAPVIQATFHVVGANPREFRDGGRGRLLSEFEAFDVHVTADITADETIYHPPYDLKAAFLKAGDLDRPGDCTGGIPLTPDARGTIAALAARHRDAITQGRGMIGVASAVARGMSDLAGAIPATVSHLPGRDWRGPGGEILIGQQVAFIPITPLEVRADPIRVAVMDHGGRLMTGKEGFVSIGGVAAKAAQNEYWGSHRFTRFGESIEIAATHVMPDGREIKAAKPLAIDDLENWLEPQAPPVIVLQLPLFLPGSFTLTGTVTVRAVEGTPAPDRCRVTSASLGIDEEVALRPAGAGAFSVPVAAIVPADAAIDLSFAAAAGGASYTARASRPVPPRAGVIDFGTITLQAKASELVAVPKWDREHPPTLEAYTAALKPLNLKPEPVLGPFPPAKGFDHLVSDTVPAPGSRVARGTAVTVVLFGKFARVMPDVRGWPLAKAIEQLEGMGLLVSSSLGPAAERPEQEHTVAEQSESPGAPVDPGTQVSLVAHGRFARPAAVPPRPPPPRPEPDGSAPPPVRPAAPRRPYYAVFALTMPELNAQAAARVPKKGDGETKEAFKARRDAFVSALTFSDFQWKDAPESESVLTIHVSGGALEKYPPEFFRAGERYACRLQAAGQNENGRQVALLGSLLLTFRRFFDRLDDVTAAYPAVKKQKEMQAVAFTTSDGIAKMAQTATVKFTSAWGPITAGWSENDRREAVALFKLIYQMFDCFVATAVYGDPAAREVNALRGFRDRVLLRSDAGRKLAGIYYRSGPRWAGAVVRSPVLRRGARAALDAGIGALDHIDLDDPRVQRATEAAARLGVLLLEDSAVADGDDWNLLVHDLVGRWVREGRSP